MSSINEWMDRIRGLDLERTLGLRPAWPGTVVALDGAQLAVVRSRRPRRGRAVLEAHDLRAVESATVPASIFDQNGTPGAELANTLKSAFDSVGARPGRASLVLPDNLAKISLLQLPERPPSRKQLLEIIRFKMHRAVPFRFSEASLTYQMIAHDAPGCSVLVALMRRSLVERYEHVFQSAGSAVGLIDLCTPNLLNLCRARVDEVSDQGDVALLNCTSNYFSLIIVRAGALIFYRCKNYRLGESIAADAHTLLTRELANSFAYYEEKLQGRGVSTVLVRSVAAPFEELRTMLVELGLQSVEPVQPLSFVELADKERVAESEEQALAPAIGAAVGRV